MFHFIDGLVIIIIIIWVYRLEVQLDPNADTSRQPEFNRKCTVYSTDGNKITNAANI